MKVGKKTGVERGLKDVGCREGEREGELPNRVARSQADPLRNGSVLLLRARELLLCAEGFVALLGMLEKVERMG